MSFALSNTELALRNECRLNATALVKLPVVKSYVCSVILCGPSSVHIVL